MSFAGTVAWMAPEVIRNEPCNEKVDIWSFGVCLWELLTCEVPYRNVDSSAIIWGVGSNSLQLPIPSSCPDGFKLLVKQCWAPKPRNRPSFKHILLHLDIAAVEILSYKPDDYFKTQQSWKREVWEHNERMKGEDQSLPLADHDVLLKRRNEELKHAQDIKELYERKLEKVNNLFVELSRWKLQLEETEKNLSRRERQLNLQTSKVQYKKKLRPFQGKTPDRFQPRPSRSLSTTRNSNRKSSPSTPEVLSTSPESPFKLPPHHSLMSISSSNHYYDAALGQDQQEKSMIVVRENPFFTNCDSSTSPEHFSTMTTTPHGAAGIDWNKVHRIKNANHVRFKGVSGQIWHGFHSPFA